MPRAENVITFPVDRWTTGFLRPFTGTPAERLDEVAGRLTGISAILFFLRNFDGDYSPRTMEQALGAVETMADDCIVIAELRPIEAAA